MPLSDDDVREILRLIDESDLDELRIETAELKLHVRRGGAPAEPEPEPPAAEREGQPAVASEPEAEHEPAPRRAPVGEQATGSDGAAADGARTIVAPMPGTFYRAERPGAEPFVDVGDQVEPGTVVCLIEIMKMMNAIEAGMSGTVVEVCADNAQLVKDGEPLFRVTPA
jgi:acetyl-CoA carboxylase biotin carboxyl carrier protein